MMTATMRSVGRYELLEVIGRGGAAVVYLAAQPDLDRQVALKELAASHAADPSFARRFVEESRMAGGMSHPSIVTVYEYFEHEGRPYMAMEYLPRGSLRPHLESLSLCQLVGVIESVLAGLAHGEDRGIIHRDLKPENLLVTAEGQVKIADFGVARALGSAGSRDFATVTGTTIGTPAYMAPEQALGEALSPATDLYSLGIVIWEALAGRTPFASRETPMAVLYRHVHEGTPPIATVRPDLDPSLGAWLGRLLAKDPAERFQSAREAWEELEDLAIELLGPRWRREAPILGSPPLAPPPSGDRAGSSVTMTIEDSQEAESPAGAAVAGAAVAGAEARPPAGETVIRPGRRHAEAAEPQGADGEPHSARSPRRVIWLLVAAIAAAAAIGGGVAGGLSGGGSPGARGARPSTGRLADAVAPIMGALSRAQAAEVQKLDSAETQSAQADAAQAVAGDYGAAERRLQGLSAAEAALPAARSLEIALSHVGDEWGALASAARHGSRGNYQSARRAIRKGQEALSSARVAVERGR